MTVGEMCGGCVKKITKRFEGVEGVAKVECSIEKQSVTLIPTPGVQLSPKGVWEIMESIAKTPKKMITPDSTFTSLRWKRSNDRSETWAQFPISLKNLIEFA